MILKYLESLILFLVVLQLASCGMEDTSSERRDQTVYDITSLLETQIVKLDDLRPALTKSVTIDGVEETVVIPGVKVDWKEMLDIFSEIDISSSKLAGAYSIQEYDSGMVHVRNHFIKPGEKGRVHFLRIEEHEDGEINLSAREVLENPIFYSRSNSNILLTKTVKHGLLMRKYEFESCQKMIARDTVRYRIVVLINTK